MTSTTSSTRYYDIICFGDEVFGILALVSAVREYRRRTGTKPSTLLMFKGNSQQGVGGLLVRGGLAYLDRSSVPLAVRQSLGLPTFGDPPTLYKEFLARAGVTDVAIDPLVANTVLRKYLSDSGTEIISRVEVQAVLKHGPRITGLRLARGETYLAKQFIDCTVNAELAQLAGVKKLKGFETFGLPESELPVTVVFETQGLSIQRLQETELAYARRFLNVNDAEAQRFLLAAVGFNERAANQFRQDLVDSRGMIKTMHVGSDHIDVRCRALSLAYHSFRGKKLSLLESGMTFDQGNIAVLPGGRLSWNALLFSVTGSQAETLARNAARPTAAMLEEVTFLERWFRSIGATALKPAIELYIRHAGNVMEVVEPLSGADMLMGGVATSEALGTFSYYLDVRGGIPGLGARAAENGIMQIGFHTLPLFNIGIQHALVQTVPNLAVVSPASGFDGYASAAGRIVEYNVGVGQGVGIAATLALLGNRNLADVRNSEVRQVMLQTGQLPRIYGRPDQQEAQRLQAFETRLRPRTPGSAIA